MGSAQKGHIYVSFRSGHRLPPSHTSFSHNCLQTDQTESCSSAYAEMHWNPPPPAPKTQWFQRPLLILVSGQRERAEFPTGLWETVLLRPTQLDDYSVILRGHRHWSPNSELEFAFYKSVYNFGLQSFTWASICCKPSTRDARGCSRATRHAQNWTILLPCQNSDHRIIEC